MTPYYRDENSGITIYHAKAEEVVPHLPVKHFYKHKLCRKRHLLTTLGAVHISVPKA